MNGDDKTAPAGKLGPTGMSESIRPRTILVVEDEVLLRLAIAAHLREAGHEVVEAADAEEAVRAIGADASIALVFTDVNMSGALDGNALARWIGETHPAIKLLVTSGVAIENRGTLPFIAKPYRFSEIEQLIKRLLDE